MKKIFLLAFISISSISCKQNYEPINDDVRINAKVVIDTTGNAKAEKNLKNQLAEYYKAFATGEAEKVVHYIYPEVFEFLIQQYPNSNVGFEKLKDSLFIQPLKEIKKLNKDDIKFEFEIKEITKKVNYKSSKLYVVLTNFNIERNLEKHSSGGEIIAISNDNGRNWKFFQNEPDSNQGILSIKFPQNIIDELLEKK